MELTARGHSRIRGGMGGVERERGGGWHFKNCTSLLPSSLLSLCCLSCMCAIDGKTTYSSRRRWYEWNEWMVLLNAQLKYLATEHDSRVWKKCLHGEYEFLCYSIIQHWGKLTFWPQLWPKAVVNFKFPNSSHIFQKSRVRNVQIHWINISF